MTFPTNLMNVIVLAVCVTLAQWSKAEAKASHRGQRCSDMNMKGLDPNRPRLIDMREPCQSSGIMNIPCSQSVDVTRPVLPFKNTMQLPTCTIELMPWSPFPCTYDTSRYNGTPGQLADLCTEQLKAGGQFQSVIPRFPRSCYPNRFQGNKVSKLVIKQASIMVQFKVADGHQFDRTYSTYINDSVIAFGTTTEPSKWDQGDKHWSMQRDITHLQALLRTHNTVLFTLDNGISDIYNVPIWAKASLNLTLKVLNKEKQPVKDDREPGPNSITDMGVDEEDVVHNMSIEGSDDNNDTPTTVERRRRMETVPDAMQNSISSESQDDMPPAGLVIPLIEASNGNCKKNTPAAVVAAESGLNPVRGKFSLAGKADGPPWPRAICTIPATVTSRRNIYRVQLEIIPKANGCEEFWALNPSGNITGSSCSGTSTGEPYRELRVYVDGQLAGFTPVYYSIYTGGVAPMLWSTVVAHTAYQLPSYTFDLGPWLSILNSDPINSTSSRSSGDCRSIPGSHSITVEMAGAANANWDISGVMMVWRGKQRVRNKPVETGLRYQVLNAPEQLPVSTCKGANLTESGVCRLRVQGRQLMAVSSLVFENGLELTSSVSYTLNGYKNIISYINTAGEGDSSYDQASRHTMSWSSVWNQKPASMIHDLIDNSLNETGAHNGDGQIFRRSVVGSRIEGGVSVSDFSDSGTWKGLEQDPENAIADESFYSAPLLDTFNVMNLDWKNSGEFKDGGVWVNSFNFTAQKSRQHSSQEHYQRLILMDVTNSQCMVPGGVTHTVYLKSFNSREDTTEILQQAEARWAAVQPDSITFKEFI
ncbi:hypothetical protein CEUSTIGMA_g12707.t1 [Chlamydomonas eustigma]|uniref:Peptide N-acetyl-beta-D-glucosaminyl asparaginase amidase A N-terminal domain-containing protein n=1 Tax=Chlamydomonas eustigma TaxID=1157962 RepID=A0A250XR56_9CHLO|nr:hypothetical protein CEUSTIGMA_g12707.t1 [Chlamydomonas eustigma]|eukprot:GAX85290.1 hypothetical protein CEUSTIGMA_g12707.t1 [Chlamydomonas eustigma]